MDGSLTMRSWLIIIFCFAISLHSLAQPHSISQIRDWFRANKQDEAHSYKTHTSLYYKYELADTICEFFLETDSTYFYREKINDTVYVTGRYQPFVVETFVDRSYQSPGQWEPKIRYYDIFEYRKVGRWFYYHEPYTLYYENGELQAIDSPDLSMLDKFSHWIENKTYYTSTDYDRLFVKAGLYLYTSEYSNGDVDTLNWQVIKPRNSNRIKDGLGYQLLDNGNMRVSDETQSREYIIKKIEEDFIYLWRVRNDK